MQRTLATQRGASLGNADLFRPDLLHRAALALSAACLALTAGCGGGGGGGGGGSPPANLSYSEPFAIYAKGVAIAHNSPAVTGSVSAWSIAPALPAGLIFDANSGVISGRATSLQPETDFTVTASNGDGAATATLRLGVVRPSLLGLATNILDNSLSTFAVDAATGSMLTTGYTVPTHSEVYPRGVTALPGGRFVYVLNQATDNISIYSLDQNNGRLDSAPLTENPKDVSAGGPCEMLLHPSADIAYVIQRHMGTVESFAIDTNTGALTSLGTVNTTGSASETGVINPAGTLMWVANVDSNSVATFSLDATTHLPTLVGSPAPTQGKPKSIVLSDDGAYLYALNLDSSNIDVFAVAADGSLSSIAVVATGSLPARITIDPAGAFLFVSVTSDDSVRTLAIDPTTGIPAEVASTPTGSRPGVLTLDGTGTRLYVAELDAAEVEVFQVDRTSGALTRQESARTREQPLYFALVTSDAPTHPRLRFAYVANGQSHDLAMLEPHPATGSLSKIVANLPSGLTPQSLVVDVRGRFLYAASSTANQVHTYAIDAGTGALTEVGLPQATGTTPHSIAIDPSERFLYVANSTSNDVSIFDIDPLSGGLTLSSTDNVGLSPASIVCDPSGRFAYIANAGGNSVSKMRINFNTGALSPILVGSESTSGAPRALAIHPGGRVLYVTRAASNQISAYEINAVDDLPLGADNSGDLTLLGTWTTGIEPSSIALDPFGRVAYVTNHDAAGTGDLSLFTIDASTGLLNSLGNFNAVGAVNPISAAVDPSGSFLYVANELSNDVSQFVIGPTGNLTHLSTTQSGVEPQAIALTGSLF